MVRRSIAKDVKEISDLADSLPSDVVLQRYINVYYKRHLNNGDRLIVLDQYRVDQDEYHVYKILEDSHGRQRRVAHKQCKDMVDAMEAVKSYLLDYGHTRLDG